MELRATTLDTVSEWRRQILVASRTASSGGIGDVLGHADLPYPYVVKVLDAHPCLGKVAGRRLLDELGISHQTRLADLTPGQVDSIARRCRCERV